MSEETPVTAHVHACVKKLSAWLKNEEPGRWQLEEGFEATLELVDMPWDQHTEDDGLFREGYETAILDVVDAIAQAWGVELPTLKVEK